MATFPTHVLLNPADGKWIVKKASSKTAYNSKIEAVHAAVKKAGVKNVLIHNREGQILSASNSGFAGNAKIRKAVDTVVQRSSK